MERLEINGTGNDHFSENEKRQLAGALSILARTITKAVLREKSQLERSRYKEYRDSAVRHYHIATAEKLDEPLTLSVQAAGRMLGLSRASAYAAIRTGQIPSLRFGKRILVPRAALNRMISQADNRKLDRTQYG
jgi:excisionase family DNA binding protein